jgi:polar amino acid transport system substrate-binding protein
MAKHIPHVSSLTSLLVLLFFPLAHGEDVTMAFGHSIAPYSFPDTGKGLELEIIGESLAYNGHKLKPIFYPLVRVPRAFESKLVDAAMSDLGKDLSVKGAFYGNPAVIYENVLFSLAEKNLKISKPTDLMNLSVVAFQGASKRYPAWTDVAKKNGRYFETAQQHLQSKMLLTGRVDLVLSDRAIFRYFLREAIKEEGIQSSINVHSVFTEDPMNYRPVFYSQKIRDDFNEGLAQLISTGRLQELYDYYTN